jgi:hypothetical protein
MLSVLSVIDEKKCASKNYMIAAGNGFLLAVSLHQHSETCSYFRK